MFSFNETPTVEEINRHFTAALDSVNLINSLKKDALTDEEKDIINRNKEHLQIMISKGWFSDDQVAQLESVL